MGNGVLRRFHLDNEAFTARTADLVIQQDRVSRALYFREIPPRVDATPMHCLDRIAQDRNAETRRWKTAAARNIPKYFGYSSRNFLEQC